MVIQAVDDDAVIDIFFELQGRLLPKDHGYALFLALSGLLPWLEHEELAAVHPIHGADTGKDNMLILNKRTKLVIRIPAERQADTMTLSGKSFDIGGSRFVVGAGKVKPLSRYTPLYAHCVTTGSTSEEDFTRDVIRLLDDLNITCRFICGRRQTITNAEGAGDGYSLMLHDLPVEQSILVQQRGMGGNRKIGCGIFIPHKSTNALV